MTSTSIQSVSSCPDYINQFIQTNMNQLLEIYNTEKQFTEEGCLGFICNKNENKMDVMFLNRDNITNIISVDSWETIKTNIPKDKKLFFVKDEILNSVFLLYI